MSQFDREVLAWINEAAVSNKAKTATLNRVGAGIEVYKRMHAECAPILHDVDLVIDLSLSEVIERAHRRLADDVNPIVVLPPPKQVPQLAIRKPVLTPRFASKVATPRSTVTSSRRPGTATPQTASARQKQGEQPQSCSVSSMSK